MKASKYNILFLFSSLFVLIMLVTKSIPMAYGYIFILLIYSIVNFKLGLSSWIVVIPLIRVMEGYFFLIYSFLLVLIYLIRLLNRKEKLYKSKFGFYLFSMLVLSLLAMLFTGYTDSSPVLIVLLLIFSASYILSQQIIQDEENIFIIGNSFIISALVATFASFIMVDEFRRLALGSSIRQLSNITGLGIVFLITLYFSNKKKPSKNSITIQLYKFINHFKFLIITVLAISLISTMSRGVIISVVLSLLVVLFHFFVVEKKSLSVVIKSLIFLIIAALIIFHYSDKILNTINLDVDLLISRFTSDDIDGGTHIRREIWKAGLSSLEGWQILYGHGLSSFQMLASRKGYDYYAHSLFIDSIVSIGIIGFVFFSALIFKVLKKIIKRRSLFGFSLFVFIMLNFSTHGSLTSELFWYSLAIILGAVSVENNTKGRTVILK